MIMERTVSLEYPVCFSVGTIMHELLHTLGTVVRSSSERVIVI